MIEGLRQRYFTVQHNYINPVTRQRAQNLIVMIWAAVATFAVLIAAQLVIGLLRDGGIVIAWEFVLGVLALVVAYNMIQRGRLDVAIWSFVGLMILVFVPATAITVNPTTPVLLILPLVTAGVLLSRRSLLLIAALFAVALLLRSINQSQSTSLLRYVPAENALPELVNYGIFLGLSAVFLLVFSGSAERVVEASYADIDQLQAANKFSASLGAAADENGVLTRLLEVIQNDLGYTLAQIYLPDGEGNFARRMRLGLGQSTKVALRVGEAAVINEAATAREPVLLTTKDERTRSEHLIPPARESVTLALVSGDTVLGVLDVQSKNPERFTENTVTALNALAAQAAREVLQARRIDELQRNVRDQEAVIERVRSQMTEFQQRSQSVASATWSRYLQGRGDAGFGFDYEGGSLVSSADLPEHINNAIQRGEIYIDRRDGSQIVNVPITLRDQVLGAFTFSIPQDRAIGARQLEMLRTVANRLGVALESNRLLEQTQAQALRERRASEIGSLLLSVTDVEAVLDLAAENFNEALGAVHTRVYLDPNMAAHSGETQ